MEENPAKRTDRSTTADLLDTLIKLAVIVLCIVGLIYAGGSYINHEFDEKEAAKQAALDHSQPVWEDVVTTEIASLKSATTEHISGSAFVMRSRTDERLRYVEKRSDGGFSLESISAENAVIYEIDDDSTPRIEVQACHLKSDTAKHQAWLDEHGDHCDSHGEWTPTPILAPDGKSDGTSAIFRSTRSRVYVPDTTIVDEFDINTDD